ncbi:MAG: hypothetical protein K5770_00690 [Lachnospiraceae bacterium]|nr:hypothetical protein [Lachnospiraceae bacterium]
MCTIAINKEFNGIELTFENKPAENIREALKGAGFRWHRQKKIWYARKNPQRMELAEKLSGKNFPITATAPAAPAAAQAPEKKNKYGVKIGDVFCDSWGYDQTNIDFYQVVDLRGATQVVLKPIKKTSRSVGWCSDMVKPEKNSFFNIDEYKTRQCGRGVETITKTVKDYGNGNIYAGSGREAMHLTTWDAEHSETSYA